jgi:hypothetical protein
MSYADLVYAIIKEESEGMDAIYRDYILELVGVHGLIALKKEKLIESCGIMNGRQLYTLCEKKD